MKSLVFFNNKGGVGKTTLACNIAARIATEGRRVLLVDCDPQCNSTLLLMGDDFVEQYYDTDKDRFTIKSILKPIEDGDSSIDVISLEESNAVAYSKRFAISLIPGHPYLSAIEDILSDAWQKLKSGDSGGIRRTNWVFALNNAVARDFDFVFFDVGPSLGALNRTVLHGCDYFITPMGVDIFSLIGVKNIYDWILTWMGEYNTGLKCNGDIDELSSKYKIKRAHTIQRGYVGYTLQQYITKKTGAGDRRPTKAYEAISKRIDPAIHDTLGQYSVQTSSHRALNLGQIPHLYSLIPLAQSACSPIHALTGSDGLIGSQIFQRQKYELIIDQIAESILNVIEA